MVGGLPPGRGEGAIEALLEEIGDLLPDHFERRRFEDAGWTGVEFTLNLTSAATLIDAGLPFILTFVEVGMSQPRLAIGYDRFRGSLYLADGVERKSSEAPMDDWTR